MNWQLRPFISGPFWPRLSLYLVVLVVITMPIYPFVSTWLGSLIGYPLLVKAIKDVALVVAALGLLVWLLRDAGRRQAIYRDVLLRLILGLLIVAAVVSLAFGDGVDQSLLAGVLANGRYLVVFFLVYASLRYGNIKTDLSALSLKFLAWAGAGLAVIGIVQVLALPLDTLEHFGYQKGETIAPYVLIDDNPDAPRAFATLRGPNDFGAYLMLPILATIVLLVRDRRWAWGLAAMLLALVLSSSRSAWLGLVVAVGAMMLVVYTKVSDRTKRYMRFGSYAAVVVGMLTLVAATTVPALQLAIFHSSPDDTHLTEGSTDDHWIASGNGIDRVVDQPLGCGIGCAGPASFYDQQPRVAENYFIQIAEEIGLVGLVIWLGLFGTILYRLWQRRDELGLVLLASGIGLSVVGLWLHVWYDDPISLTWWALAALAIASSDARPKPSKRLN